MSPSTPRKILAIRQLRREGAGYFEECFRKSGIELVYWDIWQNASAKKNLNDYSAVLVLGGPMGAYEEERYPFLADEMKFLEGVIVQKKPVLGICLGAQLLAKVLGSKVYPGRVREIGWGSVRLTGEGLEDKVFGAMMSGGPGDTAMVFHWHGDTFNLPKGAVRLASSLNYENQAFRFSETCYALQFHIEMTETMIREWVEAEILALKDQGGDALPEKILRKISLHLEGLQAGAGNFAAAFLDACGLVPGAGLKR